jgi:pimeloyl-ACP methyl ester carboxylesterase
VKAVKAIAVALAAAVTVLAAGCGGNGDDAGVATARTSPTAPQGIDRTVDIGGHRKLYLRCTGKGAPTVIMEGGDEDTSESYRFAEADVAKRTRTCVYDRANLGRSSEAPGPRGLKELVGDLERLLRAAKVDGPYVLVGTSGGGYITAAYAAAHRRDIAGLVFVETPAPFRDPPPAIVKETAWDHPANVEQRDYLQVEKDAWATRRRIGDIPVTIITDEPSADEIRDAPTASERRGMRRNVADQRGWLVLSPRAKQLVVHTGHAVEEADPELVIKAILDTLTPGQGTG